MKNPGTSSLRDTYFQIHMLLPSGSETSLALSKDFVEALKTITWSLNPIQINSLNYVCLNYIIVRLKALSKKISNKEHSKSSNLITSSKRDIMRIKDHEFVCTTLFLCNFGEYAGYNTFIPQASLRRAFSLSGEKDGYLESFKNFCIVLKAAIDYRDSRKSSVYNVRNLGIVYAITNRTLPNTCAARYLKKLGFQGSKEHISEKYGATKPTRIWNIGAKELYDNLKEVIDGKAD